jgi:uncharacterized protein DUF4231
VPRQQGDMFSRGVKVIILPAIAVLVAALPNLRPAHTWWAVGSAAAELAALLTVVYLVLSTPKPSRLWVQARTRAELLRREQYLRLAHIGPYLNLTDAAAAAITASRLEALAAGTEPGELIPLREPDTGRRWVDLLWKSPPTPVPELAARARSYLHYRIDKQRIWFNLGTKDAARTEKRIGRGVGLSLVLAMAIVFAQLLLRIPDLALEHPYPAVAALFALDLPAITACLIGLRELYAYRGRSASYAQTLETLDAERTELKKLIDTIDAAVEDPDTLSREFQAFALHLEGILSTELTTWIMIVEREKLDFDL